MAFEDNVSTGNPGNNEGETGQQTTDNQQTSQNSNGETVFLTVGERAFHTRDDVVKNISHAQQHIATVESENADLKTRNQELEAENKRLSAIVDASTTAQNTSGNGDQTGGLSKEDLVKEAAQLAVGTIKGEQDAATRTANLRDCEAKAKELYGDGYQNTVVTKGKDLGMTPREIDALGQSNPKAFAKLFLTVEGKQQSHQPSSGDINTAAFNQQSNDTDTGKNITKMREKDRISYVTGLMKQAGV